MGAFDPQSTALRLRGSGMRAARRRPVDAEISVAPRFSILLLLGVAAVFLQATLLHGVALRGAHVSLVTVLVVWTGLRCGVVAGGWLGFACGLLEDALGGSGANVIGATLVGFFSGTLANRFFSDSIPLFVGVLAGATALRSLVDYLVFEYVYGERGLFRTASHELFWAALANCALGVVVLLVLRARSNLSMRPA
jgi:rod shape-determining protein MreD